MNDFVKIPETDWAMPIDVEKVKTDEFRKTLLHSTNPDEVWAMLPVDRPLRRDMLVWNFHPKKVDELSFDLAITALLRDKRITEPLPQHYQRVLPV